MRVLTIYAMVVTATHLVTVNMLCTPQVTPMNLCNIIHASVNRDRGKTDEISLIVASNSLAAFQITKLSRPAACALSLPAVVDAMQHSTGSHGE